jgi:methylenetetrahydrofolate reductase (NADPH)
MEEKLWRTITMLAPLKPNFVSVTYGAGGGTRERTHHTVDRILKETSLTPAAHLTCVGATREEIDEVARAYWKSGIRHIVALRGDSPAGLGKYKPHPGGYPYAEDLVRGLKNIGNFDISVACYPEVHPEAKSAESDLEYLKRKIDAGANRAISQYFFDVDLFLKFLERAHKKGIKAPIIPGIIPVGSFSQVARFSKMCGASVPKWVRNLLEPVEHIPELHKLTAAVIASEQCRLLSEQGIERIHFYTLNHADLTAAVCHLLNIRPQAKATKTKTAS